jgi:hypothetical protein
MVANSLDHGCTKASILNEGAGEITAVIIIAPPIKKKLVNGKDNVQGRDTTKTHELGEIFDMDFLAQKYLQQRNCVVTDNDIFKEMVSSGKIVLAQNVTVHTQGKMSMTPKHHLLYSSLRIAEPLRKDLFEPCLENLHDFFKISGPIDGSQKCQSPFMAVHMRVENDWIPSYCARLEHSMNHKTKAFRASAYRACFGADEIAKIILDTPAFRNRKNILVIYANDLFNQATVLRPNELAHHPLHVWPPHLRVTSLTNLRCFQNVSYTMMSALAFLIAAEASTFVGTAHSTLVVGMDSYRAKWCPNSEPVYAYDGDIANPPYYQVAQTLKDACCKSRPSSPGLGWCMATCLK